MPQRQMHREVFLAHNGPGPWRCRGCALDVLFSSVFDVHHLDHDHSNNDPLNLVAMHPECHSRLHKEGWKHSYETKQLIGNLGRGIKRSAKHRAAVAKSSRDRVWTPEMRERCRAAQLGKVVSPATKERMAVAARKRARSQSGRARLVVAGKLGAQARWQGDRSGQNS